MYHHDQDLKEEMRLCLNSDEKNYFLQGLVEQLLEMAISQIIAVCRTALPAHPPGPLGEPLNPATARRLS